MPFLKLKVLLYLVLTYNAWQPTFDTAKKLAEEKHQLILLTFSGSDWCGPCIKMHNEIFNNIQFSAMADTTLIMYNADFPRIKKNQLPATLKKQNELLAEKYNPEGNFPFTVLLDQEGKVVKSWIGFPSATAAQFAMTIKSICDASTGKQEK